MNITLPTIKQAIKDQHNKMLNSFNAIEFIQVNELFRIVMNQTHSQLNHLPYQYDLDENGDWWATWIQKRYPMQHNSFNEHIYQVFKHLSHYAIELSQYTTTTKSLVVCKPYHQPDSYATRTQMLHNYLMMGFKTIFMDRIKVKRMKNLGWLNSGIIIQIASLVLCIPDDSDEVKVGIIAERVVGRLGWFNRVEHAFNPMKTDVKAEWECILQSVLLEYGRDLLGQLVDGLPEILSLGWYEMSLEELMNQHEGKIFMNQRWI